MKKEEINFIGGNPYDADSEISRFSEKMLNMIFFQPYKIRSSTYKVESVVNLDEKILEESTVKIVDKKTMNEIKSFFESKGYIYSLEKDDISLCCEHSSKNAEVLKFNYKTDQFFGNLIVIQTPTPMHLLTVGAYMTGFGRAEESLQKATCTGRDRLWNDRTRKILIRL